MIEFLESLRAAHVGHILLVLGILAVLIDYLFATDWPCHLGYALFGLGLFVTLSGIPWVGAVAGIVSWIALALLHRAWLWKILSNKPEKEAALTSEPASDSAS